jgi:hypothetical protein
MKFTKPKGDHGIVERVVSIQDDILPEARVLDDVDKLHQYDPNLPDKKLQDLDEAVKTSNVEKAVEVDETFTKESPYETVRAAVRETDGEENANTVRAWFLGFIFVTLSSGINMFLSMRSPAITIPDCGNSAGGISLWSVPCQSTSGKEVQDVRLRMDTQHGPILYQGTYSGRPHGQCHIRLCL